MDSMLNGLSLGDGLQDQNINDAIGSRLDQPNIRFFDKSAFITEHLLPKVRHSLNVDTINGHCSTSSQRHFYALHSDRRTLI